MASYAALVDQYRISLPQSLKISNVLAYAFGFFLLIAPFIKSLAFLMAVLGLSYFTLVFISLAVKDLSPLVIEKVEKLYELLKQTITLRLQKIKIALSNQLYCWSLRINLFALRSAFPL
jgi:hypothetical protein